MGRTQKAHVKGASLCSVPQVPFYKQDESDDMEKTERDPISSSQIKRPKHSLPLLKGKNRQLIFCLIQMFQPPTIFSLLRIHATKDETPLDLSIQ